MSLAFLSLDLLWRNAIGAIPLALAVGLICRYGPCKASTRHALWLIVLLSLLAPPILPALNLSSVVQAVRPFEVKKVVNSAKPQAAGGAAETGDREVKTDGFSSMALLRSPSSLPIPPPAARHPTPAVPTSTPAPDLTPQPARAATAVAEKTEEVECVTLCDTDVPECAPTCDGVEAPIIAAQTFDVPAFVVAPVVIPTEPPIIAFSGTAPQDSSVASKRAEPIIMPVQSNEWHEWFAGVFAVRDAIVNLSPIPANLWLGGSALLLLIIAIRILRFQRLIRNAVPASQEVIAMVEATAKTIGLRAAPQTLMVEHRISPLIWCGRKRLLLLPIDLWTELDETARRAVLLHELAHLKRRDHWVCWAELFVGCLYWWHPVVWWIRRKLRDEADYCCDAWVTALLPGGRSAYAKALLATRQYINPTNFAVPAVGLGVTTSRAKRFARRLTMVMTERQTPRLSMWGCALALCLAAGGWLVAPLWACPPEDCAKTPQPSKTVKLRAPGVTGTVVATPSPRSPKAPAMSTYESHMRDRVQPGAMGDDDRDTNDRLNRLEERLNQLTEHLHKMMQGSHDQGPGGQAGGHSPPQAMESPRTAAGQSRMAVPAPPSPPAMPRQPMPPTPSMRGFGGTGAMGGGVAIADADDGEVIIREYKLPDGKKEALYELMARSDVPVLVSSKPGAIEVHATARQHDIFKGFIEMINPSKRSDAGGSGMKSGTVTATAMAARADELAAVERRYAQAANEFGKEKRDAEVKTHMKAMKDGVKAQKSANSDDVRKRRQQIQELNRKARELERQAEELESKADDLDEGADKAALLARYEALNSEALAMEARAESEEQLMEIMEGQIDSLQEQLEAELERAEEQIEAAAEDAAEAVEAELEKAAEEAPEPAVAPARAGGGVR